MNINNFIAKGVTVGIMYSRCLWGLLYLNLYSVMEITFI